MTLLRDLREKTNQLYHGLTLSEYWDYLERLEDITPLRNGEFTKQDYRFVLGSYDGPSTGLCDYEGEIQMFSRFFEGAPLDDDDGLAIQGRLYAIVALSPAEREKLLDYQKAWEAHRGYYCTYNNGKRGESFKEGVGVCPTLPYSHYEHGNRKVLAWYGEQALDFNAMILKAM